tara:strand:- start:520 stop:2358 length:1839 start_codon:yes stop_codon:yes gene_type:complete
MTFDFLKTYQFTFSVIIILFLTSIIFEPLIIFLIPGILILKKKNNYNKNIIQIIAEISALSSAFWVFSIWFADLINFNLQEIKYFCLIFTISFSLILDLKNVNKKINITYNNLFISIVFLFIIFFFFFIPVFFVIAPAGADMSYHSLYSQMIINSQGIPKNLYPILDNTDFGNYPIGFHTLISFFSEFSNIPIYSSAKFVTSYSYFFLSISLFKFLNLYFNFNKSLLVTFFSIFFSQTLGFVGWGGNPTIMSIAFIGMFLSVIFSNEKNVIDSLLASFYFCASFLINFIITYASCFIFILPFLLMLIFKTKNKFEDIKFILFFILFSIIIFFPFILGLQFLDKVEINQMTLWIQNFYSWKGHLTNFYYTIPIYITEMVGKYFILTSVIFFIYYFYQKKSLSNEVWLNLFFVLIIFFLILNTKLFLLPFSYVLWPERFVILLIFPLSIFIAKGIEELELVYKKKNITKSIIIFIGVMYLSLLTFERKIPYKNYTRTYIEMSTVTKSDLEAILWLKKNSLPNDIIDTNYGDAGLWIPTIIFRKITRPALSIKQTNLYYDNKNFTDRRIMDQDKANFIFIGSKCVYHCPIKEKYIKKEDYKLIKKINGSLIYKKI